MRITLHPDQEQWLQAQIAQGVFASADEAVRRLIADRMAFEGDDLTWAKPYVDDARAAVARGEVVSGEDAIAEIAAHLATLKP